MPPPAIAYGWAAESDKGPQSAAVLWKPPADPPRPCVADQPIQEMNATHVQDVIDSEIKFGSFGKMLSDPPSDSFQPSLLGTEIVFEEGESEGMITDENEHSVFVESTIFTGWIPKPVFWELSGTDFV